MLDRQVLKLRAVGYDVGAADRDPTGPAKYAAQHAKVNVSPSPDPALMHISQECAQAQPRHVGPHIAFFRL